MKTERIISGIQQIGIGIPAVYKAWAWYRKAFGMDVPVFDEAAAAELMLPYTGGKPRERHAVFAINLQGGSGFEIWQYTDRTPQPPAFDVQLGDLGIYMAKIKCGNNTLAYNYFKNKGFDLLCEPQENPAGQKYFFLRDPYTNIFQVEEYPSFFQTGKHPTAGPYGAVIGVSDIETSKSFYSKVLGYDKIIYEREGIFDDLKPLPSGGTKVKRALLTHSQPRKGAFSKLFGASRIELIQALDRTPQKIFKDRLWGDLGFIHLCFDIVGMSAFREFCKTEGCAFTVDTGDSFDMGEAAGSFAYIEDPDGALIEFVETHKIPVIKKLGIYLNLRKRNPEKPLPNWMLKALRFGRVKE